MGGCNPLQVQWLSMGPESTANRQRLLGGGATFGWEELDESSSPKVFFFLYNIKAMDIAF